MTKIYVLHENEAWVEPLRAVLAELNVDSEFWHLKEGAVPIGTTPPEGVFYNRIGASAHSRGNPHAPQLATLTLKWLEHHGRRIINNAHALSLELSKLCQYQALEEAGIRTPKTIAAVGRGYVAAAALELGDGPWIVKPDRGGKGLDVQRFDTYTQLTDWLNSPDYREPGDGVWLVQQYITAPEPFIVRCEFVAGTFLYAMRVNTSEGFELCPAEGCSLANLEDKFRMISDFDQHPIIEQYETFLAQNHIEVAGIEFIVDHHGNLYTYDVNTNTNYNEHAEAAAGRPKAGMRAVAAFLDRTLGEGHLAELPKSWYVAA